MKICKNCECILQLYIPINSIRRRHMPKRHAKRKAHLLLPNFMYIYNIYNVFIYVYIYIYIFILCTYIHIYIYLHINIYIYL